MLYQHFWYLRLNQEQNVFIYCTGHIPTHCLHQYFELGYTPAFQNSDLSLNLEFQGKSKNFKGKKAKFDKIQINEFNVRFLRKTSKF